MCSVLKTCRTHLSQPRVALAFLVAGTMPAFTCVCLHFVCILTRRRKGDLCVPTSSITMLAFDCSPVGLSSACSTPAFSRQFNVDVNKLAFKSF